MTTCQGFVGNGNRRCGALPEPEETFCVVHLKGAGYVRCDKCARWAPPRTARFASWETAVQLPAFRRECPNGHTVVSR